MNLRIYHKLGNDIPRKWVAAMLQVENQMPEKPQAPASDPARALIAICPHGKFFAVACGATVHVYDYGYAPVRCRSWVKAGCVIRCCYLFDGRFTVVVYNDFLLCIQSLGPHQILLIKALVSILLQAC